MHEDILHLRLPGKVTPQTDDARNEAVDVLRQAFDRVPEESKEALRRAANEAGDVGPSVVYRLLGPPDSTISLVQTSGAYGPQAASRVARRP